MITYVGYHLISQTLHATSAFLLLAILRRLAVPGAWLAALLFALHPVEVESVAWMSELKNTLSGVFFLSSALAYLTFDKTRRWRPYALSISLFLCALLSKSVTVTLPVGLMVVLWWSRGRVEWRRDIRPLVPFLAIGVASALLTAWFEHTLVGAVGGDFTLTPIERVLVAGRAILFYLGKLVWPWPLIFFYERWTVSQFAWWQYAFPAAVVALGGAAWSIRDRSRAPLAALLFFLVSVAPALGFVDVYPFRFSFVADHFQYLASIGILTLIGSTVVAAIGRSQPQIMGPVAVMLVVPLAVLTWQQASQYRDAETLYRATLNRNPSAWLAQDNLATLLVHRSAADQSEALSRYQEAVRLKPTDGPLRDNLATTLAQMGRPLDALAEQREAVRLAPTYATAWVNLGIDFQSLGRSDEAIDAYRAALALDPSLVRARTNLGRILAETGRVDDAVREYGLALELEASDAQAHVGLAAIALDRGQLDNAETHLQQALHAVPDDAIAHNMLGIVLMGEDRIPDALKELAAAVTVGAGPGIAPFHSDLGSALLRAGQTDAAIHEFQAALALDPGLAGAQAELNRLLGRHASRAAAPSTSVP